MFNESTFQELKKFQIARADNDPTAITNPIARPHLEDADRHLKGDAMQMKNTVGDPSVAKVLFAHVDPATGKFTAWTFALSESALSVPRPLQTPGGSENMVPPES